MLIAVDFFDFLLILRGDYSYENKITCYFITAGRSSTGAWLWKQMHVLFCNFSRYQDSQSKRHTKDIKRSINSYLFPILKIAMRPIFLDFFFNPY